jgi:K+/H+ antiporter YhaU regulatory subunit KhtT
VAIKRTDGKMQFNPAPDDRMYEGDQLVALGTASELKALEDAARGVRTTAGR